MTKCGLLTDGATRDACATSGRRPVSRVTMLARLASVLRGTRATVTVRPEWVTARSTPALRSFCTEPSLKPHVHESASKASSTLFDASIFFARPFRAARLYLARLVRDPSAVSQIPARSLMWHLGQASRAGDVTTAKQLLRRLMDEDVLKTAV